jgi:metallopeptidase MepB
MPLLEPDCSSHLSPLIHPPQNVSMSSMSTPKSPLEAPFRFEDLTLYRVLAETEEAINATTALYDRLVTIFTPKSATFANIVRPMVDDENQAACRLVILSELLS